MTDAYLEGIIAKDFPRLALSVRQPWAWALIYAGKDIENREWRSSNPGLRHRGRTAIHASKGMTRAYYEGARDFMRDIGITCPPAGDLPRGGIIGSIDFVSVVRTSDSRWFLGPLGFVVRNPQPTSFRPCAGALGFFDWEALNAKLGS